MDTHTATFAKDSCRLTPHHDPFTCHACCAAREADREESDDELTALYDAIEEIEHGSGDPDPWRLARIRERIAELEG